VNYNVRRKDKQTFSKSTIIEAMTARGMCSNHQKDEGEFGKSKTDGCEDLKKN